MLDLLVMLSFRNNNVSLLGGGGGQDLDQRSKIEEVVPKMARQRDSDAEQSRR